jgi:hypothetical protein
VAIGPNGKTEFVGASAVILALGTAILALASLRRLRATTVRSA